MVTRRPGCLSGILKLFLLDKAYNWLQKNFGYRSGSCMGCGCGIIFLIIFLWLVASIIFGTDWLRLSF